MRTSKNLEQQIWDSVIKKISEAGDEKAIERILNGILTNQEKESIARRLAVLSLSQKGWSYQKIGELLWVSPVTISTIKKSAMGKDGYRSYYEMKRGVSGVGNPSAVPASEKETIFQEWLDYVAFLAENAPRISGPRWNFLTYNQTAPKKYRQRRK